MKRFTLPLVLYVNRGEISFQAESISEAAKILKNLTSYFANDPVHKNIILPPDNLYELPNVEFTEDDPQRIILGEVETEDGESIWIDDFIEMESKQ